MSKGLFSAKMILNIILVTLILFLVMTLFVDNLVPSLFQSNSQDNGEVQSKVVNFQKQDVMALSTPDRSPFEIIQLNFTWIPTNPKNNSILEIDCSFRYMIGAPAQTNWIINYGITISSFHRSFEERVWNFSTNGEWELVSFKIMQETANDIWIIPNQTEYQILFTLISHTNQTYIRNLNLMLLVVDG